MESQQTQKWVNFCYIAAAALLAFIVFSATHKLAALYDIEARVKNIEMILRTASLAIGAIAFFIAANNDKSNQFMSEVVVELSRVNWPTSKETYSATFLVLIMVLISGAALGFLDFVWTKLLQQVF